MGDDAQRRMSPKTGRSGEVLPTSWMMIASARARTNETTRLDLFKKHPTTSSALHHLNRSLVWWMICLQCHHPSHISVAAIPEPRGMDVQFLPRLAAVDGWRSRGASNPAGCLPTFPPVVQPPPDSGMLVPRMIAVLCHSNSGVFYSRTNRRQIHNTLTPQVPPVTNALPALSVSGVQVQPPLLHYPGRATRFPNIFTVTSSAPSSRRRSHVSD
ncbi:uncharacterized protein B0H64DRAFT_163338 [Chaetomium fimeti]|uniref:Uncharacterized protein n=1 Tax=Chaetomium fimeti TaxID=1854472 RepID=A0AAE0LTC7_9PEZI|nr:hypothetical protein B0H64DRAFT_163338 [Chaetomium fimeti]